MIQVVSTGYTPDGIEVRLPIFVSEELTPYEQARAAADEIWKAGLLPQRPMDEFPKYSREYIGYVVRHETDSLYNESGSHIVDMYTMHGYKSPVVRHYINTEREAEVFEEVSGLKLADIPPCPPKITKYEIDRDNLAAFVRRVEFILVRKDIGEAEVAARQQKKGTNKKDRQYYVYRMIKPAPKVESQPAPTQPPSTTPADVIAAGNALASESTPDATFNDLFPPSANNPFNKSLPAATAQPTLLKSGDDGARSADEIVSMCKEFYTWAGKLHKQLSHDDLHNLLDTDSMKTYFATHSLIDAKNEITAAVAAARKMASGQLT